MVPLANTDDYVGLSSPVGLPQCPGMAFLGLSTLRPADFQSMNRFSELPGDPTGARGRLVAAARPSWR